jgi:hypothetical protein
MNEEAIARVGPKCHKKAAQTALKVTQMIPLLCTSCIAGVHKLTELWQPLQNVVHQEGDIQLVPY